MILPPFPTHALPPRIRIPLLECLALTQSPPDLLASSALSVMSVAVQDKIDVIRPGGLRGPTSLYFLSIAESGERKSSGDRLMSQEVKTFDAEHDQKGRILHEQYRARLGSWEDRRRRLIARLSDEDLETEHHKVVSQLEEHAAKKPVEPARPCLLLTDANRESIFVRLHKVWPSAALLSDDAGAVFAARTLSDLGLYNKLWDGDPITRDRVTSESFTVRGARLTLSLMTQWDVLMDFLKNRGQLAQSIGFIARALCCQPESTMGTRLTYGTEPVWQAMPFYRERVRELLAASVRAPGQRPEPPVAIEMTEAAKNSWIAFHNFVEINLGSAGFYSEVKDSGAKMAENAARMAAGFHFFEGKSGLIDLESMDQAKEICSWYLGEAKRFAAAQVGDPLDIVDARAVEQFLLRMVAKFPFAKSFPKNSLLQVGPVRTAARLNYALAVLCQEGKIQMAKEGKTWLVLPNPAYFNRGGFGGPVPPVAPILPIGPNPMF